MCNNNVHWNEGNVPKPQCIPHLSKLLVLYLESERENGGSEIERESSGGFKPESSYEDCVKTTCLGDDKESRANG